MRPDTRTVEQLVGLDVHSVVPFYQGHSQPCRSSLPLSEIWPGPDAWDFS